MKFSFLISSLKVHTLVLDLRRYGQLQGHLRTLLCYEAFYESGQAGSRFIFPFVQLFRHHWLERQPFPL